MWEIDRKTESREPYRKYLVSFIELKEQRKILNYKKRNKFFLFIERTILRGVRQSLTIVITITPILSKRHMAYDMNHLLS